MQNKAKSTPFHMIEVSNTLFIVKVTFNYLLLYLVQRLNAFQEKLFDILIQIFRNLLKFPRSWIAKIATFFMSVHNLSNLMLSFE